MKRFRHIAIALMAVLGVQNMSGQQIAQYSQYLFNHMIINPAVVGSKECLDIKLGYRRQWMGFEAAPVSAYASIQARLKRKKGFLKDRHGIGAFIESDDTGPTSRTNLYLAYAYHIPVNNHTHLAFGLFAGAQQYRLDASNLTFVNGNDPVINGSSSSLIIPDITPGIWYYTDEYYAGLTLRHALRQKIKNIGDESRITHHYALTAGRRFAGKNGITYVPSFLLKVAPLSTPSLDLNLIVDYSNQISFGFGWRNTDALMGLVKVNFWKIFTFGYSFDFTTSKIRHNSSNTHEFMIGISSCPRTISSGEICPAYQ